MPKQPTAPRPAAVHHRPAPYNNRRSMSTAMVTNMAPASAAWPHHPHHQAHNLSWPDHTHLHYAPPPNMMPAYAMQHVRTSSMPNANLMQQQQQQQQHDQVPRPGQSTPWTAEEDSQLLDAKARGLSWDETHKKYFPNKSANACRKRHERVLAKARDTDWDDERIQRVKEAYIQRRASMWQPWCAELGESWQEVEKLMFQQGLRDLRNPRSSHTRTRSRASSGQAGGLSDYDRLSSSLDDYDHTDDSGISLGGHNAGHSRRASEIGMSVGLHVQQRLPSVGPLLSETGGGYGYTA